MSSKVSEFYDEFIAHQEESGLNIRHYSILNKLRKEGIKKDSSLLEFGSGIGILTNLLASKITKGKIVATDLSEKSIEVASNKWSKKNIEWIAADSTNFSYPEKFDFILLPDVIEHIPIELHYKLFNVIKNHCHYNSKICFHFPSAQYIEWLEKNNPDSLQIIDQPINLKEFINHAYDNSFNLLKLYSYPLHLKNNHDYVWAVFTVNKKLEEVHLKNQISIILRKTLLRAKTYL